ncbi:hypothetical protein [Noviherbaspirillum pedocola]|uniref:Uncharacterized protein n=1 Tax=Noviherbaspirillum pedocola TaxID=2801341 RepID=A0A934W9E9_9BURK|nr:hypothetical protein [Noviherbaspirillum pedocola]MBK4738790.1 hypothetical protein [Noviherbaspirillum pedocola]
MNTKHALDAVWATTVRAAQRLADRLWEAALPILAKACVSAVGHPSPTTGFMLAVALELSVRLVRHPLVRAISHAGARVWGLH